MKTVKYLLVIVLALLFTGSSLKAQESAVIKDYKFTVKTNPLSALGGPFWVIVIPVTGEYKASFEYAFSNKMSFQFGAAYIGPSVLLNLDKLAADETSDVPGIKTSGFKVSGMLKYFLSRDLSAPKGFYLGPHISYASAQLVSKEVATDKIGAKKLNINACIGYQLITTGGFTLDIFTGMGLCFKKMGLPG